MMEKAITPEEVDALKQQILDAVEEVFAGDVTSKTKQQILDMVAKAVTGLQAPKELGGFGPKEGMGDMENMAENTSEKGAEE
jgi:diphthamide synthase (EF-2-diphthine--ammonia ligase)